MASSATSHPGNVIFVLNKKKKKNHETSEESQAITGNCSFSSTGSPFKKI